MNKTKLAGAFLVGSGALVYWGCTLPKTVQILVGDQSYFERPLTNDSENSGEFWYATLPQSLRDAYDPNLFNPSAKPYTLRVTSPLKDSEYVVFARDPDDRAYQLGGLFNLDELGSDRSNWHATGVRILGPSEQRRVTVGIDGAEPYGVARYNRGICGLELRYDTLIKQGVPEADDKAPPFFWWIAKFPFDIDYHQYQADSWVGLWAPDGGTRGGFTITIRGTAYGAALDAFFTNVNLPDPLTIPIRTQDVRFNGNASFAFELMPSGLITVKAVAYDARASNADGCGFQFPCLQSVADACIVPGIPYYGVCLSDHVYDSVISGMLEGARESADKFAQCQAFAVPAEAGFTSEVCSTVSDCDKSRNLLSSLADSTAQEEWTPCEIGKTCANPRATAAKAFFGDDSNWRCAPVSSACASVTGAAATSNKVCQYIPKPVRLNHYPDSLELVWSDGKVVSSGAALEYALRSIPSTVTLNGKPVRQILCTTPDSPGQTPGNFRGRYYTRFRKSL